MEWLEATNWMNLFVGRGTVQILDDLHIKVGPESGAWGCDLD